MQSRKRSKSPIGLNRAQINNEKRGSNIKRAVVMDSTEWHSRPNGNNFSNRIQSKATTKNKGKSISKPVSKGTPTAKSANVGKNGKTISPAANWDRKEERIKGPWTKEEDDLLTQLVKEYGPKKWSIIASHVKGRIGKQCRERWLNHLDSSVKKTPWTEEEDQTLLNSQSEVGNKWCEIAKRLPGRPENAVKNRWNSLMNRRWSQKSNKSSVKGKGMNSRLPKRKPGRPPKGRNQSTAFEDMFSQGTTKSKAKTTKSKTKVGKRKVQVPKPVTTSTNEVPNDYLFQNQNDTFGSFKLDKATMKAWDSFTDVLENPDDNLRPFIDGVIDADPLLSIPASPSNVAYSGRGNPRLMNSIDRLSSEFDNPIFDFSISNRGNGGILDSMLNMSIDDVEQIKELYDMPLAPTPKGSSFFNSPKNSSPKGNHFRFDEQDIHSSPSKPDAFSFISKSSKSMSPAAARLNKINRDFQAGIITKEQKKQTKR
mmetsp:Transcript_2498/g.2898  ORF Transcript_2498/g.2898 Transcript_2498/m.2898 type:complete len:482 (+) Transcript_2498:162-1607(+)